MKTSPNEAVVPLGSPRPVSLGEFALGLESTISASHIDAARLHARVREIAETVSDATYLRGLCADLYSKLSDCIALAAAVRRGLPVEPKKSREPLDPSAQLDRVSRG